MTDAELEAMLEAEEREERRAQRNIIDLNIKNTTRWSAKVVVFFFNIFGIFLQAIESLCSAV